MLDSPEDTVLCWSISSCSDKLHWKLEKGDAQSALREHALEGIVKHDARSLVGGHCSRLDFWTAAQEQAKARGNVCIWSMVMLAATTGLLQLPCMPD